MGKLSLRNLFKPPWNRPFWIGAIALIVYLYLNRGTLNEATFVLDTALIGLGLLIWLAFFSQFTLPVKTIHERLEVFRRLLLYPLGMHGPAISIVDGEIQKRKGEELRTGPGVILLDTASAAVLKRPTRFVRAIGPGVVFTKRGEFVSPDSVVDLHLHKQTIGPSPNNPISPFAEKGKKETAAEYQTRQRDRNDTRALTRDGIEIVSTISVYFRLEANLGEGNTQFGFRPSSIEKAILGQNIDLNLPIDAADRIRRWDWLPAYLAADVWREFLSKFTLDELFQRSANQNGAMKTILNVVRSRLTSERTPILNNFGAETDENEESREYQLLKKRGIQVTRVEIYNLMLPDEIETQLVRRWNTTWLNRARKDRILVDHQRDYVVQQGQEDAHIRVAESASQPFAALQADELLSGREVLKRLLRGNMDQCERDSSLHSLTADEINQLQELIDWVEKQPDL
ncbi:protein containg SPFH domain [Longilinea arvoryzae]|uniref:Protein containg SPFH domain n=1 Tax=Longilinea arvoryzae TaxID=360412 RepID=A0A0S7BBX1_9CHLR|nr:SPFH domain-containing protein [Longilinea arvoryzae]GAP15198.1 protein containg SPFH domain [Longilinea arvoryzae]